MKHMRCHCVVGKVGNGGLDHCWSLVVGSGGTGGRRLLGSIGPVSGG